MLAPLGDADFPNLLFGELYEWKRHRGTGIDIVILALPATCKVWMFYWDGMRIGYDIVALALMPYGTSDILNFVYMYLL